MTNMDRYRLSVEFSVPEEYSKIVAETMMENIKLSFSNTSFEGLYDVRVKLLLLGKGDMDERIN